MTCCSLAQIKILLMVMYSKVCYNEDILENVLKSPEGLCAIVIFSVQENAKISIKHGLKWLMVAWENVCFHFDQTLVTLCRRLG
jgi:hypothetical protein